MAWLHPSWFFLFLFDRRKDGGCWSIPVSLTSPLRYRICCVILWFRDDLAGCGVCPDQSAHVQHWARTSEARQICQVLGCLFLFSRIYFLGPKNCSWQDSWGFLIFPAFSGGNFHRNVVLGRNSCGTGIPVFTLDFNWTERQYFVIYREGVEINYFLPYFIDSAKTLQR